MSVAAISLVRVQMAERVVRNYDVQVERAKVAEDLGVPQHQVTEEDLKVYAEELVKSGEDIKFTEGDQDFEETLEVRVVT